MKSDTRSRRDPLVPVLIRPSIMQSLGLDPISTFPQFNTEDIPLRRKVRRNAATRRKSKLVKAARRKNRK